MENSITIFHEKPTKTEMDFYFVIIDLIKCYPIIWNNFIENIVKTKILTIANDGICVVNLNKMNSQLRESYDLIYNNMSKSPLFSLLIANKEFQIINIKSKRIIRLFENYNWLELLVHNFCINNNLNCYLDVIVINKKLENDNINAYFFYNKKNYLFKCQSNRLICSKRYANSEVIYLFCGKENDDVKAINYQHNYQKFEEDLKSLLFVPEVI